MYLFVAQLKNQQIQIEHGCFLPVGRRPHNRFLEVATIKI